MAQGKKTSIHVVYEHAGDLMPFGVAYIRDILPLSHPVNQELFTLTQSTGFERAQVVILERAWKPDLKLEEAETLLERIRSSKATLVYSIDDNLLALPDFSAETKMAMRLFCREADGIITSTQALKERLQRLNPNIFVIPNALDEWLFKPGDEPLAVNDKSPNRKVIGYMGTFTHDADLMMVLEPLRKVLRKHAGLVEMQVVGGTASQALIQAFEGLPVQFLRPPVEDVAYPRFIPWMRANMAGWDLAIAPLEETYFNSFKSDIKFLDYSALGIPGVYSKVPVYEETVVNLETGYLAENTPDAWVDALEYCLENDEARQQMAANARTYVSSQRTLLQCAHQWGEAILSILA